MTPRRSGDDPVAAIRKIGRYEVLGLIGRGAFADVVRAWDQALASHVAIKFLNQEAARDPMLRERFVEEGQLLRRIHSDYVIGIHDVGELDDGRPFLVVDLADAGTLEDRLQQFGSGPIDADSLVRVISAMASGLTAVHAAGVVHRDVKPENLFIRTTTGADAQRTVIRSGLLAPPESLVIGDLGLAKDLESRGSAPSIIGGSAGYQAPEQVRVDGNLGPATDLYAASAVLWRLLLGAAPPADRHGIDQQLSRLPSQWQQFFSRSLDVDPTQRYANALAWESAALDYLATSSLVEQPAGSAPMGHPSVCPYKGLSAFQTEDAASFFGREDLVAELVFRLHQHRVLVVAGPSGSGKSSLVRAGLVPALRSSGFAGGGDCQIDLITPGSQPFEELHYRLARWTREPPRVSLDQLRTDPKLARVMLDDAQEQLGAPAVRVLCIDQFEELFTHSQSAQLPTDFVAALSAMVDPADSQLRVVLCVRADFYGRCAQIGWLAERITANQVLVGPMGRDSMRRAIEEPARRSGLRLEPGLVEAVLLEGGASASSLPLISHALMETWVRRDAHVLTLQGFREAGGVAGAIAQSAEALFQDKLSPSHQVVAQRLLLRLVTPGEGTADTRRRLALDELDRDLNQPELRAVVDSFVGARLLSVDDNSVEIAHEALIASWPRLRGWIDGGREDLRAQQRIGRAAREWDANGHDSDLLYRGAPLVGAMDWAAQHRESLDVLERRFLDTSESARVSEEQARLAVLARSHRNRRRATTALAVLALASVVASLLAFSAFRRASHSADIAEQQFATALGTSALGQADSDPAQAILLAVESMERGSAATVDARAALVEARLALNSAGLVPFGPSISTPGSFKVALRPDGAVAAVADQTGPIRLYDIRTGQQLGPDLARHTKGARALDFSSDGTMLISGASDGSVYLWDVLDPAMVPAPRELFRGGFTIWAVDVDPADQTVIVAGDDGALRQFELSSGRQVREIDWSDGAGIISVAFSPDGSRIVASNRAGRLESWQASGGDALWNFAGEEGPILWEIVFSQDGKQFVTAGDRDMAVLYSTETGLPVPGAQFGDSANSDGAVTQIQGVAFSSDGKRLIGGSSNGAIHTWALDNPSDRTDTAARHNGAVKHGAVSRDGARYVSVGDDKRLRVWQAPTVPISRAVPGFTEGAYGIAFEPGGSRLAVGDGAGNLHIVSLDGVTADIVTQAHEGTVFDVDWSSDGRSIVTIGDDGQVLLWDASSAQLTASLGQHSGPGGSVAFSPDGRLVVSSDSSAAGTVFVWDVTLRARVAELSGHAQGVRTAEFSADGSQIATADGRGEIRIWSTKDFALQRSWKASERVDVVWAVSFGGSGLLASVDASEDLRVWDPATGEQVGRTLSGLGTNGATGVGFNAAGDTIAVITRDGELHVVDWKLGVNLATLRIVAHSGKNSFHLVFDPDRERFATSGEDGVVQIWDLLSQRAACAAAGRRLDSASNEEILRGTEPIGCPEQ